MAEASRNASSRFSARITPHLRSSASATLSLQAMLPVWELAALAPAAVRPDLTMMTGLVIRAMTRSKR